MIISVGHHICEPLDYYNTMFKLLNSRLAYCTAATVSNFDTVAVVCTLLRRSKTKPYKAHHRNHDKRHTQHYQALQTKLRGIHSLFTSLASERYNNMRMFMSDGMMDGMMGMRGMHAHAHAHAHAHHAHMRATGSQQGGSLAGSFLGG